MLHRGTYAQGEPDPKSWDVLPNKQKPIQWMYPASASLKKEAAKGGLSSVPLLGRQMEQGNVQLEWEALSHAIGLKRCFSYLDQEWGRGKKISADKNV